MTKTQKKRLGWWPNDTWAWPARSHHLLLSAALLPDPDAAGAALRTWLAENDLDDADFSEHRLLSAVATRLGARLDDLPDYRRLVGIQRLNWTKSRMAVRENQGALDILALAGIKIVLLKGAARVALDPEEQKSRTSYDLDILVADADFAEAAERLLDAGWQSARGESASGLIARLPSLRARNLKKGRFGDLDLHRHGYRPRHSSPTDDAALMSEAAPVDYYGIGVNVPRAEERLAMAMAHGGLDGASHSDWLVDCAQILTGSDLDWDAFRGIIARRNLSEAARIAIGYLRDGVGMDLGAGPATTLIGAGASGPRHWGNLLSAADPETLPPPLRATRRAVLALRRARDSGGEGPGGPPRHLAVMRRARGVSTGPVGLSTTLDFTPATSGVYRFQLDLSVTIAPGRRRAEFEITAHDRTICFLRALCLRERVGPGRVRFSGQFELRPGEGELDLRALPGTFLQPDAPPDARGRYGALPFVVNGFRAAPTARSARRRAGGRCTP